MNKVRVEDKKVLLIDSSETLDLLDERSFRGRRIDLILINETLKNAFDLQVEMKIILGTCLDQNGKIIFYKNT